jgi:hypothetical protein
MRETALGTLRFGRGGYRWTFAEQGTEGLRVTAMHIHIDRMDVIADGEGWLLQATQAGLPYPWLHPAELRARYEALARSDPALAFVEDFKTPIDLNALL